MLTSKNKTGIGSEKDRNLRILKWIEMVILEHQTWTSTWRLVSLWKSKQNIGDLHGHVYPLLSNVGWQWISSNQRFLSVMLILHVAQLKPFNNWHVGQSATVHPRRLLIFVDMFQKGCVVFCCFLECRTQKSSKCPNETWSVLIPTCSMYGIWIPTFALKITQFCRFLYTIHGWYGIQ